MAVQDLPKDKTEKRVGKRQPGVGLRRQLVMQYILSGEPGTVDVFARKLRKGVVVDQRPDSTNPGGFLPVVKKFQVSTKLIHKDIKTIRDRWAEDEKFRVGKEEYRAKLTDLYNRAYREAQRGEKSFDKVNAVRACRDLLLDLMALDGHAKRGINIEPGGVLKVEHKQLHIWLGDKETAVVPTDAELISD